jgi:hypothetical protein
MYHKYDHRKVEDKVTNSSKKLFFGKVYGGFYTLLFKSDFGFGFTKMHLKAPKIVKSKYKTCVY